MLKLAWSKSVDWKTNVQAVADYYASRPYLKFGPAQENKAGDFITLLCKMKCASRELLLDRIGLAKDDAVATILSNVTMAIQGAGEVVSPEEGGWYIGLEDPQIYIVAPGFADAWLAAHKLK